MNDKSMLKHFLETMFCVDGVDDYELVKKTLNDSRFPNREGQFRKELVDAIKHQTISIEQFERLTGIDYETQNEISNFLVENIWKPLYDDEPIKA